MNKRESDNLKTGFIISTYVILLVFLLFNFKSVKLGVSYIFNIISPFFIAVAIAFILNIPMKFYEAKLLNSLDTYKKGKYKKLKRPISIVMTLVSIVGIIVLIMIFVIPQLKNSIINLVKNIPESLKSIEGMVDNAFKNSTIITEVVEQVMNMWKDIAIAAGKITTQFFSQVVDITMSVTSIIVNFFIAFILAIYMLWDKEKLILNIKKFMYAFFKKEKVNFIIKVVHIANEKFSKFIEGQCTEAIIIGVLVFIAMIVFKMPYAALISVIIGVTALIPIFGAIIGTIPGVFILFTISPIKSFWFLVIIVIIQQLEGHFIYPTVVGGTIGLSGIWVMLATVIGGSAFGILGILIGIPLVSIMYTLLSEVIKKKLKDKKISL